MNRVLCALKASQAIIGKKSRHYQPTSPMDAIFTSLKVGATDEVFSLIQYKFFKKQALLDANLPKHWTFLYEMLRKTSRSFAGVIQELPDATRDAVALFYIVLRALDTVEDDKKVPKKKKVALLISFHQFLSDESFCLKDSINEFSFLIFSRRK